MKTRKDIEKEIAKECGEKHFGVLIKAELSVGDYEKARELLIEAANRFINQYLKIG